MDRDTLIRAMGNNIISDEECAAFNAAMIQADCTTVDRAAMFAAQTGHESVGLRYYEEIWGPSPDQLTYQGRMGNMYPGDGFRYRGRGPIQCTGRANYTALSQWAYENGYVPTVDFFVAAPDELATVGYGFLAASWYWSTQRPMNDLSDRRDIEGATRAINGGLNGLEDRRHRYGICLALGEALLPDEGGFVTGEAKDVQTQLRGPDLGGWPSWRYHEADPTRLTLVDYARAIDAKINSQLGLENRPVEPGKADDLFGHVLSLRAEVLALTALVQKLTAQIVAAKKA